MMGNSLKIFKKYLDDLFHFTSKLLTMAAFVNVLLLILYISTEMPSSFNSINLFYSRVTLYLLTVNLLLGILIQTNEQFVLRKRLSDIILIGVGFALYGNPTIIQIGILFRQAIILYSTYSKRVRTPKRFKNVFDNAAVFVLLSFLIAIFIGSFLLLLPAATNEGYTTTPIGALFTATSATCVTGLIVYDTGSHFSLFGQIVILILIQVGGLGIMTISTSFAVLTGQRLSLRGESIMQNVINEQSRIDMFRLIKHIFVVTLLFEFVGATVLFSTFRSSYDTIGMAIYSSVFHSISGFCNAGFSLFEDSLVFYRDNVVVNSLMMFLIISGGIGFSVLVDLKKNLIDKFNPERFSLHTKIVLITTFALIFIGFVLYFIAEFNYSMEGFTLKERILSSLFQSTTTRTAGFNTIDTAALSQSSSFVTLVLMFIGASPGSTGGGIKTTSLALIILSVVAILSSSRDVILFKRKIAEMLIKRVMALIAVSILLLYSVIFFLLMIEPFSFEVILFEAFSAFGTVGLSMGVTPYLSEFGKLLIIFLMYFGRVGPLTFLFALSKGNTQPDYTYLEEKVSVG